MRYVVAPVRVALDSVSQICDSGATVTFNKQGGWIQDPDGTISTFTRDRDTYVRDIWIEKKTPGEVEQGPFSGPREVS